MIELKTERLILRQYRMEDAQELYLYFGCDKEMQKYTGWNPYESLEKSKERVKLAIDSQNNPHFYGWVIERNNELIGTIGAYDYQSETESIEIGYSIKRSCWRHGYGSEALNAVVDYLVNYESITLIKAWCAKDNRASQRMLERNGFKLNSIEKSALHVSEQDYDQLNYIYQKYV